MDIALESESPSEFRWEWILHISEILWRLKEYVSKKVRIILDAWVTWKRKVFEWILERVWMEWIKIRTKVNKIIDIPYHEFDDGNPDSPWIQKIIVENTPVYERVWISYS